MHVSLSSLYDVFAPVEQGADNGGVLVHCYGGRSRSAALVCAFLMSSLGWTYDCALSVIQAGRPVASINSGFEAQLKAYAHAKYDVYVAQQVLLRGRVLALQSYRAICGSTEDDLANKERERKKFGGARGSSSAGGRGGRSSGGGEPGSKRTWGSAKYTEDDDREQADEEDDMLCQHVAEQPHPEPARYPMSSEHSSGTSSGLPASPRTAHGGSASHLRQQIPLMDARSPRLRLSRPGSNAVRVIPPLRGLERVYSCSWCHFNLFNLASVIRTDLDVLPLPDLLNMDAGHKSSSRDDGGARGGSAVSGFKTATNSFLMPAPSPRASVGPTPRNSFAADAKSIGYGGTPMSASHKNPPRTTRGASSKTFSFDLDSPTSSPDVKGSGSAFSFGAEVFHQRDNKGDSPTGSTERISCISSTDDDSDMAEAAATTPTEISRERNRLYLDVPGNTEDSSGSNSARSKPPTCTIPSRVRNVSITSSPSASPRIPLPPQRGARESYAYPSPRDRPPSAEKRRWLARVNLLRADQGGGEEYVGSQSKCDLKVAKLSNDDDEAIKLGFGREKYIHIEYLEWMGDDVLSPSGDEGEIRCEHCRNVLGMWTWNPTERYVCVVMVYMHAVMSTYTHRNLLT